MLFLVDVSTPAGKGDKWIVENVLKKVTVPVIMVLNKTDKASPKKIDENILSYKELYPDYVQVVRISAKTGKNKSKLVEAIKEYLHCCAWLLSCSGRACDGINRNIVL